MIESTILSLITFLKYLDTTATLAINGLHCTYLDNFMMMYSGRFIWIPLYLSLLIIMLRNFPLRVNIACILVTIALVTINDQVSSTLIRPFIARLRPSNLLNPISQYIHIVDGYRGGSYGFPSAHAANCFGTAIFVFYVFRRQRTFKGLCYLGNINVLLASLPRCPLLRGCDGGMFGRFYQCLYRLLCI